MKKVATENQLKYWKSLIGRKLTEAHKKKIGLRSLGNKNTLGRKQSPEEKEKRAKSMFKGDDICKRMKHTRIEKKYGTPSYCEICKKTDKKKYEWANTDHKYVLKREFWRRLCTSCHKKYDIRHNGIITNTSGFWWKTTKNHPTKGTKKIK